MENALCEDLPVGVYRTHDKIKNLKIRVKLKKIPNACFTEKDSFIFGSANEFESDLMKASAISDERVFSWQEKIEKSNKNEDSLKDGKAKTNSLNICLFSYVYSDVLSPQWKQNTRMCTYPASQPSHLEKHIAKMKPRTRLNFSDAETWQKPLFSHAKNIVKTRTNVNNSPFPFGQCMILMAALFFEDSQSSEEIELGFLQIDDNGSLTVIPDFTKKKSYTFVNSRSETFEYKIENVSDSLTNAALLREKHLMKKISLYKEKIKGNTVGVEFTKPVPDTSFFTLNCEIISAKNFSSSDIFIRYLIILPKGMTSESCLEGVTETCRCKTNDMASIAYYGYIFSLDLTADIKTCNDEPVKIIFDITSLDYWGNFRNEGYGYQEIILNPGTQVYNTYTWKIEPTNLRHKLQNFFIGGMPYLENISYLDISKDLKDSPLSRYGVCTMSSGIVIFKSYVIVQNSIQS